MTDRKNPSGNPSPLETIQDIASLIIEYIEKNARPPKVYKPKRL